ncbi:hypothetical protein CA984_01450 [Streptosporangium minutum]|uniref:Uncharacterized protein n=1 Tax=Streptosporangium minutum TaxID=569862 RepID=A0A243RX26_9ACTN|nr:hypothetical protein CA984_01450 [Streptosporangium minutum]
MSRQTRARTAGHVGGETAQGAHGEIGRLVEDLAPPARRDGAGRRDQLVHRCGMSMRVDP